MGLNNKIKPVDFMNMQAMMDRSRDIKVVEGVESPCESGKLELTYKPVTKIPPGPGAPPPRKPQSKGG